MKKIKGQKRDKGGFSLVEITMTVAIIGILAAVAVPNYERIKLQMNMEMVKQHMRIIGEKLTEIMGKQGGQAPSRATWGQPSGDEDEISLTANLAAIDEKGYTTEDWTPPDELNGYNFTSCPKDNGWGSSGDRCFSVDPFGVHEMAPWTGIWVGVNTWNSFTQTQDALNKLFNYSGAYTTQLKIFEQLAEFAALYADASRWQTYTSSFGGCSCDDEDKKQTTSYSSSTISDKNIPSSFFILDANQIGQLNQFLDAAKGDLAAKGIYIETRVQNVDQVVANCKVGCNELPDVIASTQNPKGLEVSFKLDNPVETNSELAQRQPVPNLAAILAKLK